LYPPTGCIKLRFNSPLPLPGNAGLRRFPSGRVKDSVKYASLDDGALIDLIAGQDAGALSALYDRHSRLVYSIAIQMLGDGGRAEEVTLDVFTRLWENAASYDPARAKVRTWIVSMARNRAIDVLRRIGARPEGSSVPLSDVGHQLEANGVTPEEAVEKTLEAERVREALAELPPEQEHVITLAYFRGYTQSEIADTLNLPLGTVKTRIRLGMEKLRRTFVREPTDPESGSMRMNK
jgi:RNA polymerase sigma-70 factor (ECF subfamily)